MNGATAAYLTPQRMDSKVEMMPQLFVESRSTVVGAAEVIHRFSIHVNHVTHRTSLHDCETNDSLDGHRP